MDLSYVYSKKIVFTFDHLCYVDRYFRTELDRSRHATVRGYLLSHACVQQ